MRIGIAGGHGQIALLLAKELAARGDQPVALIRNPDQANDVRAAGAEPAVVDLEHATDQAVAEAIQGCDAVVFAAGAGPNSGPARKESMDYGGAVKLIAAAKIAGISRYVIVSSMGADAELEGDDTFSIYQRAKGRADDALRASGLDFTVVRPGGLTNEALTGRITIAPKLDRGQIPRADVAATLAVVLNTPGTIGQSFDLLSGDTPIAEAVTTL